ncbi:MAG: heavy metal translocating P-type ATPase [Hyphomicrobiales bacterium]
MAMSCCGGGDFATTAADSRADDAFRREVFAHAGHTLSNGDIKFVFSVPTIHCGACISTIEHALTPLPGVKSARVNLSLKRLNIVLEPDAEILAIDDELKTLGFPATPVDLGDLSQLEHDQQSSKLLKALAVAGFAAGNIMLLSVSVWSGADGPTRDLFHFISALIAIPVVAYSGQVFFRSAFGALRHGRLNMDVPISLAVSLALAMSLFETFNGGSEAYFDAAVTLLFFLLIGRYLDQRMRDRARNSVVSLSKLAAKGANCITSDGQLVYTPIDEVKPGMQLRVFPGDRVPVDGSVMRGTSDLDRSLVTGESELVPVMKGYTIEAGTLNVTGALDLIVKKEADQSFLSEVMRMLEAAENGRGAYVRIADRMARIYAPAVHLLALFAFIGWMFVTGGDWYVSLTIAIAVLIVTCPCALGLAVPVVHVVGATKLFQNGILMRDGSALERLAETSRVVFDKTGTLTMGTPAVVGCDGFEGRAKATGLSMAKVLARHSAHPASKSISRFLAQETDSELDTIREVPGFGVEGRMDGKTVRLGRADWVNEIAGASEQPLQLEGVAFAVEQQNPCHFFLDETLRQDAVVAVSLLQREGKRIEILSGDSETPVRKIAKLLGIDDIRFGETPKSKFARIQDLQASKDKVLMVGDGINDAPSLAAGHASIAPATAADVGRQASDFVFTRDSLMAIPFALMIAKRAGQIIRQNFGLAILYNCIAVPLALCGYITPLVAAIAMSASSIVVVTNSLRLLRTQIEAPEKVSLTKIKPTQKLRLAKA